MVQLIAAYVREIIVGGIEIAYKVGNYLEMNF